MSFSINLLVVICFFIIWQSIHINHFSLCHIFCFTCIPCFSITGLSAIVIITVIDCCISLYKKYNIIIISNYQWTSIACMHVLRFINVSICSYTYNYTNTRSIQFSHMYLTSSIARMQIGVFGLLLATQLAVHLNDDDNAGTVNILLLPCCPFLRGKLRYLSFTQ